MKRKMVWSLTALLAGAGFATAQDMMPPNRAASDIQLTAGQAPETSMAARVGQTNAPVLSQPACMTGCDSYGNGSDHRIYGRLEYLLWNLNSHLNDSGSGTLPALRYQMPYAFRSASYDITDPQNVVIRPSGPSGEDNRKNVIGIAQLDPRLFAGSNLEGFDRNGGRLTVGMFLDSRNEWSAEMSFFQMERKGSTFIATASANGVVFTPGINDIITEIVVSGDPPLPVIQITEIPVSFQADLAAAIEGTGTTRLLGLEANMNHRSFTVGQVTISEVYGGRYIDLEHNQTLAQVLTVRDDRYIVDTLDQILAPNGATTALFGQYFARNQFYGAQVGLRFDADYGRFFMNGVGKFGFGALRQELTTQETVFNSDVDIPFEVYPSPINLQENRTRLAFMLEGNLNAGYRVTDCMSVYAGYNIMLLTRVARPSGNGLPANGAGTITVGSEAAAAGPAITHFQESRFYAHGLNIGLEFRFYRAPPPRPGCLGRAPPGPRASTRGPLCFFSGQRLAVSG